MKRLLGVVAVGILVAGAARADIPPPKGLKRVVLDNKITTEKEYPEVAFFLLSGGDKVEPVKLDPKTPLVIEGAGRGGRYRSVQIFAVPKDAAKNYDSEKAFHEAIAKGKVEGQVKSKTAFGTLTTVKDTDPRKSVVEEYKLEKIDPKEGLVITAVAKKDPTATPPKDGLVAGLAATLGLVLTGLWVVRRNR